MMKPLHGAMICTVLAAVIWLVGSWQTADVGLDIYRLPATAAGPQQAGEEEGHNPPLLQQLRTFRGADVDGQLRLDSDNKLVINLALRQWFDFHLAAQGELPLADIISLMQREFAALAQPGRQQAEELLQHYLGYLQELADYDNEQQKRQNQAVTADMIARVRWQQRLRRQWFEPSVVEAFFAGDRLLDDYMIQRLEARAAGANEQQIAQLEQQLPEPLQQMRQRTRLVMTLQQQQALLRQQGADAQQLQQWRRQQFGDAAAERLQQLDQRQQNWQQRLKEYQLYRESPALQDVDISSREQLLQTYRHKHFSETEQKRLAAAMQLLSRATATTDQP